MATERLAVEDDAEASPQPEGVSEKEIGGITYRTRHLPFSTGLPLLKRLIDVVAPVIAAGLRGGRQYAAANILDVLPTAFTEKDLDRFADAFGKVSQYLNDDGQWVTLVKNSKIDNREKHFTGRYLEFMQWLFFCCEVNFSSFFGGAAKGKEGEEAETVLDRLLRMVGAKAEKAQSSASDSGTTSNTE
jgi:hypothetical protein